MYLSLTGNLGGAIASLDKLRSTCRILARGGERRDILPPLVEEARTLADEVFINDASPDGTPWVPVQKDDGEALEETGAMRASLFSERGPYSLNGFAIVVGYGDEKARHHHYGTKRGGPISDEARRPFHPKVQRRGRWENVRSSARMDASGRFGAAEQWHIPPRPLLPIDDIEAPAWQARLEAKWLTGFGLWLERAVG